ncbi:MAG: efflux RND transporter periplasmic adaptor subunit [Hyphomicrobiaceae bacterium]
MSMPASPVRAAIGAAVTAGLLAACGEGAPKSAPAMPPASVVVSPVLLKDLNNERNFTGRIEAIDKVQIRARVQGFLKARLFDEGAEVKQGEILYKIEPEPFELAVQQAEANVSNAEAGLTLAQQNSARTEELAGRGTASKAALDQARSALAQAQSSLRARQAELQTAKLNLGYTSIEAPMAGRVGRSAYSVGNLVGPDSGPLALLVAQDPVYVSFPVPQWLLIQVRKAGRGPDSVYVKLKLADGTDYEQTGTIEFTDVQATSSTDSIVVRAKVPNPDRLLVDQQLVGVQVIRKQAEQKLVVSQSALLLDQQGPYVLAVDKDSKVLIKRIEVGPQRGTEIVVNSGLGAGERVIVSGHQKARPGAVVTATAAEPADKAIATESKK